MQTLSVTKINLGNVLKFNTQLKLICTNLINLFIHIETYILKVDDEISKGKTDLRLRKIILADKYFCIFCE